MAMTVRRKLAIATWSAPSEGNIYGKLTLDATEVRAYIAWLRETSGEKVTVTHVVGKAVAQSVDIAFLVALEGGRNLAKAKVNDFDKKSVVDAAVELRQLAEKLHSGKDESFKKSMGPIKMLPTWIIRPIVKITGYLTAVWGVNVPALGLEAYPFGSAVITNVGVFGLDEGFAPPTPFAHVPLLVLMGAIRKAPWVDEAGELTVREQITITATIDHRFMDGAQGGILAKTIRRIFDNPWSLSGLEGRPEDAEEVGKAEQASEEPVEEMSEKAG